MQKTNFEFEILIHDDASTDKTANIIREYEQKYPGIIKPIYQTENQYSKGIKPSIKFNFPRAKGKYIAMCEGDDYWTDPLKLQKQVDFLEANKEYICCGTYCDTLRYDVLEKYKQDLTFQKFKFLDFIEKNRIPTLTSCFRNKHIDYSNFDAYIVGDIGLFLTLLKDGGKLAKLPFVSSVYRYHGNGANSGNSRYLNIKYKFETKYLFAKTIKSNEFKLKLKYYFLKMAVLEIKNFLLGNSKDLKILVLGIRYFFK